MARRSTPDGRPPPDTARAKRAAFIAAGVFAAAIGLVVVLDLDGDPQPGLDAADDLIIDLVPEPLARDEGRRSGIDRAADGTMPDLAMMRGAVYAMAVADAVPEVRRAAAFVTTLAGGDGAVREVIEHLLREKNRWDEAVGLFG